MKLHGVLYQKPNPISIVLRSLTEMGGLAESSKFCSSNRTGEPVYSLNNGKAISPALGGELGAKALSAAIPKPSGGMS
jgi:hypothetical protein